MAFKAFPTENNVGSPADSLESRAFTELKYMEARRGTFGSGPQSKVLTGWNKSGETGLSFEVAAGKGVIHGYHVESAGIEAITLPASTSGTLYLKLAYTSELVSSATLGTTVTTDIRDCIPLWDFTTDATTITSETDRRDTNGGWLQGTDTVATPTVDVGVHPYRVHFRASSNGGADTWSASFGMDWREGCGYRTRFGTDGSFDPKPGLDDPGFTFNDFQVVIPSGVTGVNPNITYLIQSW